MKSKKNIAILNKKRFQALEQEKISYLRSLSVKKSIKIMEKILDSGIIEEYKKIYKNNPTL